MTGQRATFGRIDVRPNGTNAVPSAVTAWLDARAESTEILEEMVGQIERLATERAERDGTAVAMATEASSPRVDFDAETARRLSALGGAHPWPVIPTMAGHDAGILAAAGRRTAMLFVRNPTGVSHSPDEHAEMGDCLAGVEALADVLAELTGAPE